MLAHVTTFAIHGVESRRVTVEVDLRPGLPAFTIVGLGDRAVREARERVRSAILNSGFAFPPRRITVNLAPAALRKEGPGFDLAIACGVLAAAGQLPIERLERVAVFGELALGGELRSCRGVLAVAEGTVAAGLRGLVLPRAHAQEAALVDELAVLGAADLGEVAAILRGESDGSPSPRAERSAQEPAAGAPDHADVRGPGGPRRARAIAATAGRCARWRSRPRADTTSCWPDRRAPARRCSPSGCRRSCHRCRAPRRSRSRASRASPACVPAAGW
jgi:magnesium chelatase family protein